MGEAKRRKSRDPKYGKCPTKHGKYKTYMSYLELPHTKMLVNNGELRRMIKSLRDWTNTHEFYATVVFDNTGRWRKIEKLCLFIGMEKLLNHKDGLYATQTVFITKSLCQKDKMRLIEYFNAENSSNGRSTPPPPINRNITEIVLLHSQENYEGLLNAEDVKCIYQSSNCAAFSIPASNSLDGLNYIEFFTRVQLQVK